MSLLKAIIASLVAGNPQDILFKAIPENTSNRNDKAATAEYREAMDEMVAALHKAWDGRQDSERPTADDVFHGYQQFKHAYEKARNHKKRRILFNAFWNSFKPEFYDDGVREILWEKLEELEYPDLVFLKRVLENTDPKEKDTTHYEHDGEDDSLGQWRGNQLPVRESEEGAEYAERLSRYNLVEIESSETRSILLVSWKGLASKLKKFALDDFFENYEAEKSKNEAADKPAA
jgi:hypothetical protein